MHAIDSSVDQSNSVADSDTYVTDGDDLDIPSVEENAPSSDSDRSSVCGYSCNIEDTCINTIYNDNCDECEVYEGNKSDESEYEICEGNKSDNESEDEYKGNDNESEDEEGNKSDNVSEGGTSGDCEAEDSESRVHEDHSHPDPGSCLYTGAPLTVHAALLLIMAFVIRHNLTNAALTDLLTLLNMLLLQPNKMPNKMPKSAYKFYKYLNLNNIPHFYCSKCEHPLNTSHQNMP